MSADARTILRWTSVVASSAMVLYGIAVRGKTVLQRRRQRAFVFLGTGFALGNSLWEQLGLSDAAVLALSIGGTLLIVIGIVLLFKARYDATLPSGSSGT
jgi:hypothetical protein